MNKKVSIGVCISLVIIAVAATFAITMVFSKQIYNGIISNISQRSQSFDSADEINSLIANYYYGDLNEYNNNLGSSLAEGYVNGLNDANSYYMTASEYESYNNKIENGLTGVGVESFFDFSSNKLIITYVYDGSPAQKEGLKSGDVINRIDGETVRRSNYEKLSEKLFSSKLVSVSVEYTRKDYTKAAQMISGFAIPSIISKTGGTNGYIRIGRFYKNTSEELDAALASMQENGVESVLFDVRNTSEGTIKYAAQAIDVISPNNSGYIASAVDKSGKVKETFPTHGTKYNFNYAVLINSSTSGPAELFACDLRDILQAELFGTSTAGVGTMQELFTLDDGSAILLTTALVIPKNGETAVYDKEGVKPTREVTLLADSNEILMLSESEDNQLREAMNYLNSNAVETY